MALDIRPPAYSDKSRCMVLPTYSSVPVLSEHVLSDASDELQPTSNTSRHEYRSRHLLVDLGTRRSPFELPAYGLDAIIEGSVKFSSEMEVEHVTVQLDGCITTDTTGLPSQFKSHLLSVSMPLWSNPQRVSPEKSYTFSIAIPNEQADGTPLPPTYNTLLYNSSFCNIRYVLRIDMVRKGWLARNESISVPMLYLPKSSPQYPPLTGPITPPIVFDGQIASSSLVQDRVKTHELRPLARPQALPTGACPPSTIHLSLPSDLCFASGENIPFILTISCTVNPKVMKLISPNIRVTLHRQTRLFGRKRQQIGCADTVIGQGRINAFADGPGEGVQTLRGSIPASTPGKECCWKVDGVAEVSYFIRAVLRSPPEIKHLITDVQHEERCQLVTDQFGGPHRELLATGGIPTPALGIIRSPLYHPPHGG